MVNPAFMNQSGTIGVIFTAFTLNVSGSEFVTLLGIIVFLLALFFMFRIPVEATIILILPIFLIFMAFSGEFLGLGLAFLMYLGFLLAKNYFIN